MYTEHTSSNAQQGVAPHPSRQAPHCAKCKHAKHKGADLVCNRPATPVSLVTGISVLTCAAARQRDDNSLDCGPEGRFFERNPSADCLHCLGRGWRLPRWNEARTGTLSCDHCLQPQSTAGAALDSAMSRATATTVSADQVPAKSA